MPAHGDVKGRHVRKHDLPPRTFQARNGEGSCVVNSSEPMPVEHRFCDRCGWIFIEGVVAFFQADHVGCLKCGKPWPKQSKST